MNQHNANFLPLYEQESVSLTVDSPYVDHLYSLKIEEQDQAVISVAFRACLDVATQLESVSSAVFLYNSIGKLIAEQQVHSTAIVGASEDLLKVVASVAQWSLSEKNIVVRSLRELIKEAKVEAFAVAIPFCSSEGIVLFALCGIFLGVSQEEARRELTRLAVVMLPFLYCELEKKKCAALEASNKELEKDAQKREVRFQITQTLQSKIDVEDVLTEMFARVKELYPEADTDLLMTMDYHSALLPVKPLRFSNDEEDVCTRAFLEGELIYQKDSKNGTVEVAVPLSGKQGVYGVLHLKTQGADFDRGDIQMLIILASTAGTAFENAKLYEQSNLLVSELRLINELTKRLNTSLKLNETFHFACSELIDIFQADYCYILGIDKRRQELIIQASNDIDIVNTVFPLNYGIAGLVCSTKEPVIVSDYDVNLITSSKIMEDTGSRSVIAAPILASGEVEGVIIVTHRYPNYFSYDNYKLLQVLSGHIGLAISNASLHAEVKRMVITDNLTGLYARHYLNEQIGNMQKKDASGSLIMVDIDYFKNVNDTYGHQIGDQILIQVSQIIKSSIREGDIPARWGGEELAIYLPQVDLHQAARVADRIRYRVESETDPKVTVSCGISEWNWKDDKVSVEVLFYRSDMALYKAKHTGRNTVQLG